MKRRNYWLPSVLTSRVSKTQDCSLKDKFFPKQEKAGLVQSGRMWSLQIECYLTLSQVTNFSLFQLKGLADDNFNFNENGTKFSSEHCGEKEKTLGGKGEMARYEPFLLYPQCFQKTYITDT